MTFLFFEFAHFIVVYPEINPTKPEQDIPLEITEIIQLLEKAIDQNKIDVAHFLLNLSSEAKQ